MGKTFLVEAFGRRCFDGVLTVNLEQKEDLHRLFESMDPQRIVQELGLYFNQSIIPGSFDLRTALELLELAGFVSLIRRSAANGVPLGDEASEDHFKPLLLDIARFAWSGAGRVDLSWRLGGKTLFCAEPRRT